MKFQFISTFPSTVSGIKQRYFRSLVPGIVHFQVGISTPISICWMNKWSRLVYTISKHKFRQLGLSWNAKNKTIWHKNKIYVTRNEGDLLEVKITLDSTNLGLEVWYTVTWFKCQQWPGRTHSGAITFPHSRAEKARWFVEWAWLRGSSSFSTSFYGTSQLMFHVTVFPIGFLEGPFWRSSKICI